MPIHLRGHRRIRFLVLILTTKGIGSNIRLYAGSEANLVKTEAIEQLIIQMPQNSILSLSAK